MADPSEVSIVIPAYNEGPVIAEVVAALTTAGPWREIIVVDDGSTDDTGDAARRPPERWSSVIPTTRATALQ